MPIIGPRNESRGFGSNRFAGFDTSPEARIKSATYVLTHLSEYVPKAAPERPEALDLSDTELAEAARKLDRTGKASNAEKEALQLYGSWRAAVFKIEAESAGNLIMLLSLLNLLESQDSDECGKIRDFVREQYHAPISGPPAPYATTQFAENWASRYAEQRNVLPMHLRNLSVPVMFLPRKPVEATPVEDDDANF